MAVAGWYADPADPARVRWWDGTAWTDHVQVLEPEPAPSEPAPSGIALEPTLPTEPEPAPTGISPEPEPAPSGISLEPLLPAAPAVLALDPAVTLARAEQAQAAAAVPEVAVPDVAVPEVVAPVVATPTVVEPAVVGAPATVAPPALSAPSAPSAPAMPTVAVLPTATITPATSRAAADVEEYDAAAAPSAVALLERPGGFDPEPGVVLPPVRESTLSTPSTALRPGAFAQAPPLVAGGSLGVGRSVPWVTIVVAVVILGLLGAGTWFVGLPWYQAREATEAAASVAPTLAQQAPTALARQRQATVPGFPGTVAADLVAQGSSWAWAAAYGREANRAFYLAAELPRDQWAVAVRALEDPAYARELMAAVGSGLVAGAGSEATVGVAREYATLGAGRTWCREVWLGGRTGGHCLWTNGREMLQAIHLPSVEALAAKKTLVALQQLSAAGS